MTLGNCAEKWYLGYNHMLTPRGGYDWSLVYGDAGHRTLNQWYQGVPMESALASLQLPDDVILDSSIEMKLRFWQAVHDVQLRRYAVYYQDDLEIPIHLNETILTVEYEGLKLCGKIDLGKEHEREGPVLDDHKFIGRFDPLYTEGFYYRFQFMFYMWLANKAGYEVNGMEVNAIKKPALKQGQYESIEAYAARVEQAMIQEPEKYFKRTFLPFDEEAMIRFEQRVLRPKLFRLHLLTQHDTPDTIVELIARDQNTDNCVKYGKKCPFMPMCQNGWMTERASYKIREHKHEELVDE